MVDSRQKGARAEADLKKKLREATELNFQRTPGSGALNETHKLKGDIYIPNEKNKFCIEVKHYKDDHLTSKILTSKEPQLITWWEQAVRQANLVEMCPLLFFKHDRSKWFTMFRHTDIMPYGYSKGIQGIHLMMYWKGHLLVMMKMEDFIQQETLEWTL